MRSIWLSVLICALVAAAANGEDSKDNEIDAGLQGEKPGEGKKYSGYSGNIEDRGRLINVLLSGYDKRNYPTNTTIQFGVALLGVDIDENRNSFEAETWQRLKWNDKRLQWDKKEYDVGVLRLPSDSIWVPDTTLYNSVDLPGMMKCHHTNTLIYPNGDVLWVPPCHLSGHCDLTLWKDPFGPQKCYLKFGSWTFDGLSIGLDFYDNKKKADVADYRGAVHWDLLENEATRDVKYYDCCTEPYISLTYNFTLQRKPTPSKVCQL